MHERTSYETKKVPGNESSEEVEEDGNQVVKKTVQY